MKILLGRAKWGISRLLRHVGQVLAVQVQLLVVVREPCCETLGVLSGSSLPDVWTSTGALLLGKMGGSKRKGK